MSKGLRRQPGSPLRGHLFPCRFDGQSLGPDKFFVKPRGNGDVTCAPGLEGRSAAPECLALARAGGGSGLDADRQAGVGHGFRAVVVMPSLASQSAIHEEIALSCLMTCWSVRATADLRGRRSGCALSHREEQRRHGSLDFRRV